MLGQWSPDGAHVYGIDGGKLGMWPAVYRLDLASGEATLLVEPVEETVWLWASPWGASWRSARVRTRSSASSG